MKMHVQILLKKNEKHVYNTRTIYLSIYLSILYLLCCKFTRKHIYIYIHIVQNMYMVLASSLPPRTCYYGPPMFPAWEEEEEEEEEEGWALEIWQGEFCLTPQESEFV